jgi:excisionase family DNA binding protein
MFSFHSPNTSQQFYTGILVNRHITVQAAAEATGYNLQYLRRILRSGVLKGCKIGQMWLIEMDALEAYPKHVENTSDRRCGPR